VNGVRVDIPSFQVSIGDKISIHEKFKKSPFLEENIKLAQSLNRIPSWLQPDYSNLTGEILSLPNREHIDLPIKEQVIVELYSK